MNGRLRPCVTTVIRVLACLGGLFPTVSVGQTIVWTDQDARRIQRKDVNSAEVATIVQFQAPQAAYQIHYDPITAKLYYSLVGTSGSFQRAYLDGSDPENIPTPSWGTFTLNVESRKLYWINPLNVLNRSDLNGAGVESHHYPNCCIWALEAVGDDLFFGAAGGFMPTGIWRADPDGSNEQSLHVTGEPADLAYDPVEAKLYVASGVAPIARMNSDGSGFETIIANSVTEHITVDYQNRKLYWTHGDASGILRSNLDGSNVEDFVTASDAGNPNLDIGGLTIVYNSTPIPTLSDWGLTAMAVLLLGIGLVVMRKRPGLPSFATSPRRGLPAILLSATGRGRLNKSPGSMVDEARRFGYT